MKLSLLFILFSTLAICQTWTAEELAKANTCANTSYLTKNEKEVIQYVNLARMYPAKYAKIELVDEDKTTTYYKSLVKTLNSMKPVLPLAADKKAYESAKCFALEQSVSGEIGHDRENCESYFFGECCSYGMETGRDIVVQLLIDEDIPSLGHRKICLSSGYSAIGLSFQDHKVYRFCCVLDFV
jgi:uncharacterized protein YkwD